MISNFIVAYIRDTDPQLPQQSTEICRVHTLREAKESRICTGDLVFDGATGAIVEDNSWLFAWERPPASMVVSYPRKKILEKIFIIP